MPPRRSICLISSELEAGEKSPCVALNCKPLGGSFPKPRRRGETTSTGSQPGRPPGSPGHVGDATCPVPGPGQVDAALPPGSSWSGRTDTKQVTPPQSHQVWSGWPGKEQGPRGRTWGARRITEKVKFKLSVWSCPLSRGVSGQAPTQTQTQTQTCTRTSRPHTYARPHPAHLHTRVCVHTHALSRGPAPLGSCWPLCLSLDACPCIESRLPNPRDQPLPVQPRKQAAGSYLPPVGSFAVPPPGQSPESCRPDQQGGGSALGRAAAETGSFLPSLSPPGAPR